MKFADKVLKPASYSSVSTNVVTSRRPTARHTWGGNLLPQSYFYAFPTSPPYSIMLEILGGPIKNCNISFKNFLEICCFFRVANLAIVPMQAHVNKVKSSSLSEVATDCQQMKSQSEQGGCENIY